MKPPDNCPDWDRIIAHTCHMTGWTWDYVEEHMTMPRLKALHEEWRRHPPVPLMIAAYLGIKPQEEGTTEELLERIAAVQNGL